MKRIIVCFLLLLISAVCFAQDNRIVAEIIKPGKYKFVGELGVEMGDTITVRGIIVQGPFMGNEGGPNLIIQSIRDSFIQEHIQIPVLPYFGKFGNGTEVYPHPLPQLRNGDTYSFLVYETGGFVGRPNDAYKEAGIQIQTSGFYFRNQLVVISGKNSDPVEWSPEHFIGRKALLSGIAKNEGDTALIQSKKWVLKLTGSPKWSDAETGKTAEVYGMIRSTNAANIFIAEDAQARLTRLEDQLGKTVKLRGTARSLNGEWWFNYRGIDMYVENMADLPGWTAENHFSPMEITGTLGQQKMPRIDQLSIKSVPDLKLYYIVRNASWKQVNGLLTPEMDIKE